MCPIRQRWYWQTQARSESVTVSRLLSVKSMKKLTIIGCGNVGKTLGHLWARNAVFEVADVLNRSIRSSSEAVEFIQAGRPVAGFREMNHADVFLIGTSDNQILQSCKALAASGVLQPGNIVFQCSGAIPSASLGAAKETGALVASVHPVKSFSAPDVSVATFGGTFCGTEGDDQAIDVLSSAFEAIGGRMFGIDPQHKTIYHAALVLVCNYLTALLERSAAGCLGSIPSTRRSITPLSC